MIFRAVFWIGLVALLAPHEPDLGLGRPGAGTSPTSPATPQSAASGLSRLDMACGSACAGGLGLFDRLQAGNSELTARLQDIKAQLKAARAGRAPLL